MNKPGKLDKIPNRNFLFKYPHGPMILNLPALVRNVLYGALVVLGVGFLVGFFVKPTTIPVSFSSVLQSGSKFEWALEPEDGDSTVFVPSWGSFSSSISAKRIQISTKGGSKATLHLFVENKSKNQSLKPKGPVVTIEAKDPFRTHIEPLLSGALTVFNPSHFMLWIPESPTMTITGMPRGPFHIDFSSLITDYGAVPYGRTWAEPPSVVFLSSPPTYPASEAVNLQAIQLVSTRESKRSIHDAGTIVNSDIEAVLKLSLAVSTLSTSGSSNGRLQVGGHEIAIPPDDKIEMSFSPWIPAQFQLETTGRTMSVVGKALTISLNGTDLRPRLLESWPWWVQWLYSVSMGVCCGLIFTPALERWLKREGLPN